MKQFLQRRFSKSAFTLIELSVVLTIIAIFIGLIVVSVKSRMDAAKLFTTKERMQLIMDAMDAYVEEYGHIPCPADITLQQTDSNYGIYSDDSNFNPSFSDSSNADCSSGTTRVYYDSNKPTDKHRYYNMGMVPFKVLGLDSQIAVDAWGNRFDYIMTAGYSNDSGYKYARAATSTGDSNLRGQNYIIKNKTGSSTSIASSQDIAYILISHGPNLYSGYNDASAAKAEDSPNADELENSSTADDYTYIQTIPSANYDDIVIIKKTKELPEYINKDYIP